MADNLTAFLLPYREKREVLIWHAEKVTEILANGTEKARTIAQQTMDEVRRAINIR